MTSTENLFVQPEGRVAPPLGEGRHEASISGGHSSFGSVDFRVTGPMRGLLRPKPLGGRLARDAEDVPNFGPGRTVVERVTYRSMKRLTGLVEGG